MCVSLSSPGYDGLGFGAEDVVLAVLQAHRSCGIRRCARFRAFGMYRNCAYAEGFIKQQAETHYYLPLTDNAFEMTRMSDHELITKKSYRVPVD